MSAIPEYFEVALAGVLTVAFSSIALACNNNTGNAVVALNKIEETSNLVVYEGKSSFYDSTVTRQELVSSMMHDIEYPVVIEGIYISPDNYNYINFDYTQIPDGIYEVTYVYETDGSLSLMRYDRI